MKSKLLLILVLMVGTSFAGSFYHQPPATTLLGEMLRLELQESGANLKTFPPTVYYRSLGEFEFHSIPMESDGFNYFVEIPTTKLAPGKLQYYFALQSANGQFYTYPEGAPYSNYFETEILPTCQQSSLEKIEINLLSPEENEVLGPNDVFLSFSIPLDIENPEKWNYRITIDGVDQSARLQQEGHVLSFVPGSVRSGMHLVSFKVYTPDGILVGQKQFQFRVSDIRSNNTAFSYKGSLFLDSRVQSIAQDNHNYTRGGLRLIMNYQKFQIDTRMMINSNESPDLQPLNIYSARLKYQFSYKNFLY